MLCLSQQIGGAELSIHAVVSDDERLGRPRKQVDPDAPIEINQSAEVAVALGVEPAIKFLGIPVNQLGLGYRFGDYEAVVLATTFPF